MTETHDQFDRQSEDWSPHPAGANDSSRPFIRRARRRTGIRRACLGIAAFTASVLFLGLIAGGVLFARLSQGPIAIDLAPQIAAALNQRVGHGYAFEVGSTAVEASAHGPALTLTRLAVNDAGHHPVITAPKAAIAIDPLALMAGRISPRHLEIHDVDLRLLILADGQVAVSAGTGAAAVPLSKAFSTDQPVDHAPSVSEVAARTPATDRAPTSVSSSALDAQPGNAALRALAASMRSLVDATTAPDSALGAFDDIDVTGRLVLDDRTNGRSTAFNDTELSFVKAEDGSAVLKVAADGPTGRWTLAARASRNGDSSKMLTVEVHGLSLDEITLAGGLRGVGFDFDMPISATVSARVGPSGSLDEAIGRFQLGAGYFKLDDPDHEPLLIDSVTGGFHLDPATRSLAIERTELRAGESDFTMTGHADLPNAAGEPWKIVTQASGIFGTERPGEKPIKIPHAGMAFRVIPKEQRLVIDRIDVQGPEVSFEMFGDVHMEGDRLRLTNTSTVKNMPAHALVRLWPSFIAAPVRAWFLSNLRGGTVVSGKASVDLDDRDLALMRAQRSVADDHVHVEYAVSDLALAVMPGLPPLAAINGSGVVTGDTSQFSVSHAEMEVSPGRKLTLVNGSFNTPDTDPKPTPSFVDAHVTGGVEAVADLLSREALKPYANVPIDSSTVKGQVDAHLGIALKLGEHVPPEEAKVTASANVTNFSIEKLVGKEGLTDGSLQLNSDRNGLRAKGEGRIYGAPASIELKKASAGTSSEAVINLTLDDAARSKAGITLGKSLTGIVTAHVATTFGQGDRKQATIDLDFTKAVIEGVVPGFSKPLGKPAKATASVVPRDGAGGASLDNLVFEGGGASLRGAAELDASGALTSARLSQVRLSPGDDMRLDAAQSPDGLKLVARGANVDARPFLKWLGASGPGGSSDTTEPAKNLDLELHANVLTGQNSKALSNADIRFTRRAGQVRTLQISGRFGRAPLSVATVQQGGAPLFVIKSADAGESLAFMDLYKRMLGGRLDANISARDGKLDGYAAVHDFTLREDPAVKKLAAEGLSVQNRTNDAARIDTASVQFTKLEAYFSKAGNRVNVRDGTLVGPAIGATVEGTLDFGRDQINLQGTFVPLYGVNNLFSQVPLFGPILGGGAHEGLFGLTYRITGSAGTPVLSVNPLSAMAPGFLRQIFGAMDNPANGALAPRDRAEGPRAEAPPVESPRPPATQEGAQDFFQPLIP